MGRAAAHLLYVLLRLAPDLLQEVREWIRAKEQEEEEVQTAKSYDIMAKNHW